MFKQLLRSFAFDDIPESILVSLLCATAFIVMVAGCIIAG